MSIFRFFKKKEKKSVSSSVQTDQDRRTYLINGEWVHVPFCGGAFCFDYREDDYEDMAAKDYRAKLLDSVDA